MAHPKKGALHQVLVPMVDATDFASIESAITASDFNSGATVRFYGLNTGGSAAVTSGAVSKIASLVRSGVFRITLKTTENNYDLMMLRINKTGCAEQILTWSNVDNDDSDIMSQLLLIASAASDAASAAVQGSSRVLLVQSRLSDLDSRLASELSDVLSGIVALSGLASDAHSAAAQGNSRVLLVQSRLSDLDSRLASEVSDLYSLLSDLNSNILSRVPKEVASKSLLSDVHSDLRSQIAGITVAVDASALSDIASAVRAAIVSDLSDILSAAQQGNSRVLVVQSMVSDVRSHVSDLQSDFQSRVPKRVATDSQVSDLLSDVRSLVIAGVGVTVAAISDIASQVRGVLVSDLSDILSAAQQTNSRALIIQSIVSDVRSHVSDLQSDFQSRVPKRVATDSQLSDLASDLKSAIGAITVNLTPSDISDIASAVAAAVTTITNSDISDIASRVDQILASRLSDILSAAQQANSRVLLVQSHASDIYSLLSAVDSNFQSRVPKRVATDSQLSALASDVLSALAAGVPVSASDMSDLRSAIAAGTITSAAISDIASAVALQLASSLSDVLSAAQQTNSRVLVTQSRVSDVYSLLSDFQSDFVSRVPKRVATDSQVSALVSDLASQVAAGVPLDASSLSDIRSAVLGLSGMLSDAYSAAAQGNSRALVVQSQVSDIYSLLSDLHSDVGALSGVVSDVHSALVAGVEVGPSSLSDLRSAILANGVLRPGAEPGGVVGHTDTHAAKVDFLAALAKNKQTLNKDTGIAILRNDADDATIASRIDSDDGTTYTKGEFE